MKSLSARRAARGATVGLGTAALVSAFAAVPLSATAAPAEGSDLEAGTSIQVLAVNDFHGALSVGKEFACVVTTARAQHENSFLLSAGDNVGGSEFASAIQNDEPTLKYLNALEVDMGTIGNHEYDQGYQDLLDRIIPHADFPQIAANVYVKETGKRLHDPYTIVERNGVKMAVVGAVTTKTVQKVSPVAIEGLEFRDPVDEVNKAIEELKASGADYDLIVANYHEGASGNGEIGSAPENSDPIFTKIVNETSAEAEVILNGDSHRAYAYQAPVPGTDGETRPIIQGAASGAYLGAVTLTLEEDGDWEATTEPTLIPSKGVDLAACAGDPIYEAAAGAAEKAIKDAEGPAREKVGTITGDITTAWDSSKAEYKDGVWTKTKDEKKGDNRSRHSAAGNMLADSMKWFFEQRGGDYEGREIIGFMNPGGIRAEFWHKASGKEGDGVVTYGEANNMTPFGNTLNSGEVTGAQFKQMLEEQWSVNDGGEQFLAFGVSENVTYTFDSSRKQGERVLDLRINGKPIDPKKSYTVVAASFLFQGGDGMNTMAKAKNIRDSGVMDRDALSEYLKANPDLKPNFAQRAVEMQIAVPGEYDSKKGKDVDPVLRFMNLESQSIGAPKIEKVIVDAGKYGRFEAPYELDKETGRWKGDVTLTDWLCVPEGTVVPLTVTAVPETGANIVIDMPSFTWQSGEAPKECGGADKPGDDDKDKPGDDKDKPGKDKDKPGKDKDDKADGKKPEDLARTGADAAPYAAGAALLTLAGLGALGLRRFTRS